MQVDLNCDMGEGFGAYELGADTLLMPLITSANIACGFHAGDPQVMRRTVRLAVQHGVAVGAHPGFRDLVGFGRREMACTPDEVYADVLYQVGALGAICRGEGARLHHVKPHGALYNMASVRPDLAGAIAAAVRDYDPGLVLYALPGSALDQAGQQAGLRVAGEVFADRAYTEAGTLVPRSQPGAVLQSEAAAEAQVLQMVTTRTVTAITGQTVPVRAETVCIHGDNPHAVAFVQRVRQRLLAEGVTLAAC